MVELIDYHHVEVIGGQLRQAGVMQRLDGGKDVRAAARQLAGDEKFSEGAVAECLAESALALLQDFTAMCHKQQ